MLLPTEFQTQAYKAVHEAQVRYRQLLRIGWFLYALPNALLEQLTAGGGNASFDARIAFEMCSTGR
jgi:hypothetical protein